MHHAQGKGNVFTTDLALSVIMSAPRSVASWDIVMHRAGESIYLDVREGSAAFDTIVNETAQDAPEDEGKDGNMNRSAQEVKDALMNRSSLNQRKCLGCLLVLVLCPELTSVLCVNGVGRVAVLDVLVWIGLRAAA